MTLAAASILEHLSDHPWPGATRLFGLPFTWMSSAIASMILVAIVLVVVLIPASRRASDHPRGLYNLVELIVMFVRDMIAKPALHGHAYDYLSYLVTLFVFILGMNLLGLLPIAPLAELAGLPPIGATPTAVATVCGGLAATTLGSIFLRGLAKQARLLRQNRRWPWVLCVAASPSRWFLSLSPRIEGCVGSLMTVPLAVLEFVGVLAKCFSLMVRLTANMLSGHVLLAVMMTFILQTLAAFLNAQSPHVFYVGPGAIIGSVLVCVLELLVAALQAYIFTFLTAMFLGLYVEGH